MSASPTQEPFYPNPSTRPDDEIDLRQMAGALGRHRRLIAIFTGASLVISGIYAFTRKPVWEGQFQIVLEKQDSGSTGRLAQLVSDNPLLSSFAGIAAGGDSQLQTEVKVLESPSVLKPTYDFVKANKAKAGENINGWTFHNWRDSSLEIELEKGTSVLNIAYRDTDRKLVLPVIRKISRDYQLYSGSDRSKSISNGLAFVKEQVEQFRQQAATSSRALDAFSIRYGIANSGEAVGSTGFDVSQFLSSNAGLRLISSQLGSRSSSNSIGSQGGDALGKLAAINQELIRKQQQFTSRDPGVLALIRERDALRRYIEVTAGGSLTLPGQQPKSKEQAQELLLQFKELKRKARRDVGTLDVLERSLMSLQLEQARQTDPWELISTPTMLDRPVAPNKKSIVAIGLLAGLVAGSGVALLLDRRTGLVHSEDELKSLLPCPLIKHLPAICGSTWTDAADLLAAGPLAIAPENSAIALVPIGNIPKEQLQAFSKELNRAIQGRELLVSTDLCKTSRCATQLLVTSRGVATHTELSQIRQKLALQGTPLAGWVFLDPELNLD